MFGSRSVPLPSASSFVAITSVRQGIFSGERPARLPRRTSASISPGFASALASAAAFPPKLPPTIATDFAPDARRYRTAARTSWYRGALMGSLSPGPCDFP